MPELTIEQALQIAVEHHTAGRMAESAEVCRRILELAPDHAAALNHLGAVLHLAGDHVAAEQHFRRAAASAPQVAAYHQNLGVLLSALKRYSDAAEAFAAAIRVDAALVDARYELAVALFHLSRHAEAAEQCRLVVGQEPGHAKAWNLLGMIVYGRREFAASAEHLRRASQAEPQNAGYHYNLAMALAAIPQPVEAADEYRAAIACNPKMAEAYNNLSSLLLEYHQPEAAGEAAQAAVAVEPGRVELYANLASALLDVGLQEKSVATYHKALAIDPHQALIHSNLICAMQYNPASTPQDIARALAAWNERFASPVRSPLSSPSRSAEKLRIGFVSGDFREHPVGRFVLPLFAHLDRSRFEITCYSNVPHPDNFTTQLQAASDYWRDVCGLSDEEAAQQIRQDGVHILVDLALHMARHRLLIFAQRPAPVQATWLGYCGSTGLDTMDFRISDPYFDPPREPLPYSEQTLRLPNTFWCYPPPPDAPPVAECPAVEAGWITFGCLNNFTKVNPRVISLWARVLLAVPDSRMRIYVPEGKLVRKRVADAFASAGVDPSRITCISRQNIGAYLGEFAHIDIALDPFPFNGGTTSCDGLWMGVPLVTLAGDRAVGRAGASILHNIGLPELIASSEKQYIQIARGLGADLPRLRELRSTLRRRMQSSPLMDAPAFARAMEGILLEMWDRRGTTA